MKCFRYGLTVVLGLSLSALPLALAPSASAATKIGTKCTKVDVVIKSGTRILACEKVKGKLTWTGASSDQVEQYISKLIESQWLASQSTVTPTPAPSPTPIFTPVSTPLPPGFDVHTAIGTALGSYNLAYSDSAGQAKVEASIHDQESYYLVLDNLVATAKRLYPGFASQISRTITLVDVIKPWADALAQVRNLPLSTFENPNEGFILALAQSPKNVDQSAFSALLQRYATLNQAFDQLDRQYWISKTSDPKYIHLVFENRDPYLSQSDSQAISNYKSMDIAEAKKFYQPYAFLIDQGQTMDQAGAFWVNRFAADLEISPATVNPQLEPIILTAVSMQGYTTTQFDSAVRQDPRWQYTSVAKNGATALASQILCMFGYASCTK